MFYKNFLLLFCLLPLTFNLSADEVAGRFNIKEVKNCKSRFENKVSYSTCLDSALSEKVRVLNTWKESLNLKLKEVTSYNGRRDAIVLLKKSNQAFEKFKENNCKWQYLSLLPDINDAANMSKECHIYMTIQRINELKQLNEFKFY